MSDIFIDNNSMVTLESWLNNQLASGQLGTVAKHVANIKDYLYGQLYAYVTGFEKSWLPHAQQDTSFTIK